MSGTINMIQAFGGTLTAVIIIFVAVFAVCGMVTNPFFFQWNSNILFIYIYMLLTVVTILTQ